MISISISIHTGTTRKKCPVETFITLADIEPEPSPQYITLFQVEAQVPIYMVGPNISHFPFSSSPRADTKYCPQKNVCDICDKINFLEAKNTAISDVVLAQGIK